MCSLCSCIYWGIDSFINSIVLSFYLLMLSFCHSSLSHPITFTHSLSLSQPCTLIHTSSLLITRSHAYVSNSISTHSRMPGNGSSLHLCICRPLLFTASLTTLLLNLRHCPSCCTFLLPPHVFISPLCSLHLSLHPSLPTTPLSAESFTPLLWSRGWLVYSVDVGRHFLSKALSHSWAHCFISLLIIEGNSQARWALYLPDTINTVINLWQH